MKRDDEYLEDVPDEWLGISRYKGQLFVIRGTLPEFILDYDSYDPEFSNGPGAARFRDGVTRVTTDRADRFLRAMNAQPLTKEKAIELTEPGSDDTDLLAFIDFDAQRLVHSYYDLPLEDYVPQGWKGVLGDPRLELKVRLAE